MGWRYSIQYVRCEDPVGICTAQVLAPPVWIGDKVYVADPDACVLTDDAGIQLSSDFCGALKCIARWLPIVSHGSPYSETLQLPPIDALPQLRLPACKSPKLCPISCAMVPVLKEPMPLINARC